MTRAAIIVQRYGASIIGGAESHARQIATHLHQDLDWDVEILTTTCRDYESWAPHYSAGPQVENKQTIHRFHPDRQRSKMFPWFNKLVTPFILLLPQHNTLRRYLEQIWFRLQGPSSQALFNHAITHQKEFDVMIFFSAIYPLTNQLIDKVKIKTALIPTLHDEPPLYFFQTQHALKAATKVFLNSQAEANLLNKISDEAMPACIVGLGFDQLSTLENDEDARPCSEPYILYLGRIGKGKRVQDLIAGHEIYNKNHPNNKLKLVLVGQQEKGFHIPLTEQIVYIGNLDEHTKNSAIQNAEAIVSASRLESLSMILFEAIQLGTPAIMSSLSPVMHNFAKQMPAIRCFQTPQEFAERLTEMRQESLSDPAKIKQNIRDSQLWVHDHFSWQKVLEHYAQLA